MQVPILNGIFTNSASDFRISYPRNLIPVAQENGISKGYLRPSDGMVVFGTGPGVDRGGINWDDICFRVMGTKLIEVKEDGTHIVRGDVGGRGQVTMDYGPNFLGIASSNKFFLYDKTTNILAQVTDPNLGNVIDFVWVDGYYMTTDGINLVVTELTDPFSVDPFKFASSEANPDPIVSLVKIRNEVYVLNRYTVEVFDNVGGSGFPFQRIEGAQIEKGAVGTHAACIFTERIAFVGSGFNEAPSVYLGVNGQAVSIATREIDQILLTLSLSELENIVCEVRLDKGHQHLWIRLPDQTLVYDANASQFLGVPVWFTLTSNLFNEKKQLRAQNLVRCYDKWLVGDPLTTNIGVLVDTVSDHYGEEIGWEFGTTIVYNEARGALFHEVELICLTGRVKVGVDSSIWTQYSLDGETFSNEKIRSAGMTGQRNKRISWLRQGRMRNWRIQRFRGTSESHLTMARLDIKVEPLNV